MSLHSDLLDQAGVLVRLEPRKPRQASLRRAVSAAYYALFHLLSEEAANMVVKDASLRLLAYWQTWSIISGGSLWLN